MQPAAHGHGAAIVGSQQSAAKDSAQSLPAWTSRRPGHGRLRECALLRGVVLLPQIGRVQPANGWRVDMAVSGCTNHLYQEYNVNGEWLLHEVRCHSILECWHLLESVTDSSIATATTQDKCEQTETGCCQVLNCVADGSCLPEGATNWNGVPGTWTPEALLHVSSCGACFVRSIACAAHSSAALLAHRRLLE